MRRPPRLQDLQAAYLGRKVPGHRVARVGWSQGTTQVIEAGHGSPVLLVHGGLGEAFQWAPLLPLLARSHRVLAVDRPGHGLADASQRRNYPSWISMVNRALDIRGMKPHMLLHDRWASIQPPGTLIWGELDAWSPPEPGEAIAAAHPHIRMVRVPGAGHAPWFDDAASVAREIERALNSHLPDESP